MAHIIDGRKWAAQSRQETAVDVARLAESGVRPGLCVIIVGENPASLSYVKGKEKAATEVGIASTLVRLDAGVSEADLLRVVREKNEDEACHGILVQLPLPSHIDPLRVIQAIDPRKDVDGFHTTNAGALAVGLPSLVPCTPLGVMKLLAYEAIETRGMHAVIVGRSNIVGKPLAHLLLQSDATVSICHSRTRDLGAITRTADILVAAVGRPGMITADMVKSGAVVIDVGINRVEAGLVGDVDFSAVSDKAGAITPVPRGVGPMTIAMLLHNTVQAAQAAQAT